MADDIVWDDSPQDIKWDEEKPATNTLGQEAKRQGGMFLRQALSAAGSVGALPADAIGKAVNYLAGREVVPNQQRALQQTISKMGIPEPERPIEKFGVSMAESAPAMALPGAAVPQMLGNAAIGATQAQPGQELKQAGIGAAGGGVVPAAGWLLNKTGGGASQLLGATSGVGAGPVKEAFKDSPGFVQNMRGAVPESDVVESARTAASQLRNDMYDRYAHAKGGWAADETPLAFKPIVQAEDAAASKFGFQGVPQPGVADVQGKVRSIIADWQERGAQDPKFFTVEGMDALKRHLQDVVPENVANRTGRAYVTEVVNGVKKSIVEQAPKYKGAMEDYWNSSKELDEIARNLSLGDKATVDTALRKLQTVTRPHAGQRSTSARRLDEAGAGLAPALSGQAMNAWTPQGMQRLGGVLAGIQNPALLPAFSPRMVGEMSRYAGKATNSPATQTLLDVLRRTSPTAIREMNEE